jgi:uncharacterized protein (TIGR03382 family)
MGCDAVTACASADGCCPAGCISATDSDCEQAPADGHVILGGCSCGVSAGTSLAWLVLALFGVLRLRRAGAERYRRRYWVPSA